MFTYNIGSVIEYVAFGGVVRTVNVTNWEPDIKNGCPGFDGITTHGESVWGYDRQITRVVTL